MSYKRGAKGQDKALGKAWRILAESTDGLVVTLGKYDTKESAEADKVRIEEEGFYRKVKITYTPIEPKPGEEAEPAVEAHEERRPRARRPAEEAEEAIPDIAEVVEPVELGEDEEEELPEEDAEV